MRRICIFLFLCLLAVLVVCTGCSQQKASKAYQRIVIASDVHYITKTHKPEKRKMKEEQKLAALQTLNKWQDVDLVVFLGDLIEKRGSAADYAQAKLFYDKCTLPKTIVAGNHELIYKDEETAQGKLQQADAQGRKQRQEQFLQVFDQKSLYYTKQVDKYLLIFLAPDKLVSKRSVELSEAELAWLEQTLEQNKNKPTVIFCHAPLQGTLANYNGHVNKGNSIVHPAKKLQALLTHYAQIKLWVSGHTHTPVQTSSFADSQVNTYQGKFLNLHNPTWEAKEICVNSLYLYPDKIEIKTYNLTTKQEMTQFNRTIKL